MWGSLVKGGGTHRRGWGYSMTIQPDDETRKQLPYVLQLTAPRNLWLWSILYNNSKVQMIVQQKERTYLNLYQVCKDNGSKCTTNGTALNYGDQPSFTTKDNKNRVIIVYGLCAKDPTDQTDQNVGVFLWYHQEDPRTFFYSTDPTDDSDYIRLQDDISHKIIYLKVDDNTKKLLLFHKSRNNICSKPCTDITVVNSNLRFKVGVQEYSVKFSQDDSVFIQKFIQKFNQANLGGRGTTLTYTEDS